jgi:hypothetical protein
MSWSSERNARHLGSLTQANLPTPSSALVGKQAYCTNYPGSSTGCDVVCDGHKWTAVSSGFIGFFAYCDSAVTLYNLSSNGTLTEASKLPGSIFTVSLDPTSSFSTSTGLFTVPESGVYDISFNLCAQTNNKIGDLIICKTVGGVITPLAPPYVSRLTTATSGDWSSNGSMRAISGLVAGEAVGVYVCWHEVGGTSAAISLLRVTFSAHKIASY